MPQDLSESQLQSLVQRVFDLFDADPTHWPDVVQFNRSGYSDANVRGIWTFRDEVDFINVRFPEGVGPGQPELPIKPESSGAAD